MGGSSISFLYYELKKNKVFLKRSVIQTTNLSLKCINRLWVLINNPPATQFSYKFEFILCKNWRTSDKDIKSLNCQSSTQQFEVVFPGTVLNQRMHFAVLILKTSFTCLGAIMKHQKYSESEALHEIQEVLRYPKGRMANLKMN